MSTTHASFDTSALTSAFDSRDAEAVAAHYAEDATFTLLDRDHPPSQPRVFRGREEITEYYRDICGRDMDHEVRDEISTDTGLAYTEHCRYPDGTRVLCTTVATVKDGHITDQTAVQVWDS